MGFQSAFDNFAPVSRDMTRATTVGGAMSAIAMVLCSALFLEHVRSALYAPNENTVRILDSAAFDIDINLNVTLWDLPCEHVSIGVLDALGSDLVSRAADLQNLTADHMNGTVGQYSEEELEILEKREAGRDITVRNASLAPAMGAVAHLKSLDALVENVDYTFIAFMVDWCPYCRMLRPYWETFVSAYVADANSILYKQALDRDGKPVTFAAYAIDCDVDRKLCMAVNAQAYPTVRMYRGSSTKFDEMQPGVRGAKDFVRFAQDKIRTRKVVAEASYRKLFDHGCRVSGVITVPAVPGMVRIGPKAQSSSETLARSINPFTVNVSHEINHFSFGANVARRDASQDALEGTTWRVEHLHENPVHFVSVVSTVDADARRTFSMTHSHRVARVSRDEVPLVKIHYDLSPIEVVHFSEGWTFYHFLTSVLAVVGGSYSVVEVVSHMLNAVGREVGEAS